jgi:hypothetical protein
MNDPQDERRPPDVDPGVWRRLMEIEQLLREAGNPDPDQPHAWSGEDTQDGRLARDSEI